MVVSRFVSCPKPFLLDVYLYVDMFLEKGIRNVKCFEGFLDESESSSMGNILGLITTIPL